MRKKTQAGFTLIEVMIASVASWQMIAPAIAVSSMPSTRYAEIQSQIALNREARQAFDLIATAPNPSRTATTPSPICTAMRAAQRGARSTLPVELFAFAISEQQSHRNGDSVASMTVTCSADGVPLPDCIGTESKTVAGWIGKDLSLSTASRSVVGRTVETNGDVNRSVSNASGPSIPLSQAKPTARFFTLNRDIADP